MFGMTFQEPGWLWLLLLLIPMATWDLWRKWRPQLQKDGKLGVGWKLASVGVRVLMLGSVVIALARPVGVVEEKLGPVVFVLDRSASVSDKALDDAFKQAKAWRDALDYPDQASLVVFDAHPLLIAQAGHAWPDAIARDPSTSEATDMAAALEMALGLIPPDAKGQVVLLTDAQPTRGDVTDVLAEAKARGVLVHTGPLERVQQSPELAQVVLESSNVRPGESVKGHIALQNKQMGPGRVTFELSGQPLGEPLTATPIPDKEGAKLPFEREIPATATPGPVELKATFTPLDANGNPVPGQAQSVTQDVVVDSQPRVVIVTQPVKNAQGILSDDAAEVEPISATLRAEGMLVERISTVDLAALSAAEQKKLFDRAELFILANVAVKLPGAVAPTISEDFLENLRRFVSGGGGLIVLGGDRSFELGGYAKSPLARFLPVKVDPLDVEVDPAVTMIIVLDRSGSMAAPAGDGKTKMDLANAGAVASMKLLRPFDYVGVTAVDDATHWIVPVQAVVEREAIERSILGISSGGGGIYVYTSLEDARKALLNAETPLRHIVLFSDARDSEEQVKGIPFGWGPGPNCYDLAKEMREQENITTSVIGIGTEYDSDAAFLKRLAQEGGGRFYMTEDANKLLSLFVEETQRLIKSRLHEDPFSVSLSRPHPSVEGIDFAQAPQLKGYLELEARETAEVILRGAKEHPILVTWQYGLGQVFAAATDLGPRWAQDWLTWPGYDRLWVQLSRHSLMRREGRTTSVGVDFSGDNTRIQVVRRSAEGLTSDQNGLRAKIVEVNPDGSLGASTNLSLQAREPGLWQTDSALKHRQTYRIEVSDVSGEVVAQHTFIAPPSAERRPAAIDTARLNAIAASTGGEPLTASVSDLPEHPTSRQHPIPTWFYWALAASLMLPIDAFLRRPAREI